MSSQDRSLQFKKPLSPTNMGLLPIFGDPCPAEFSHLTGVSGPQTTPIHTAPQLTEAASNDQTPAADKDLDKDPSA